MLDLLTVIIDDGEYVDLSTLSVSGGEDDDCNALVDGIENIDFENFEIPHPINSFDLFLNKLLHSQSIECVKSIQHFTCRVSTLIWQSRKDVAALFKQQSSLIKKDYSKLESELKIVNFTSTSTMGDISIGKLSSIIWNYLV